MKDNENVIVDLDDDIENYDNETGSDDVESNNDDPVCDKIDCLTASVLIINAVKKELVEDAPIFETHCQNYNNLSDAIIRAYSKLNFRERSVVAARLGFHMKYFSPAEKEKYADICIEHGVQPATASRIFKKALRKISTEIITESRGE